MFIKIMKKIVTALAATVCLSLIMSLLGYTPTNKQVPNTVYLSFVDNFIIYILFSAPVFLVVGILFSVIADRKIQGRIKTIISYLFAGGIIALLLNLLLIIGKTNSIVSLHFIITGMFGAFIFYAIQSLINKAFTSGTNLQ